MLITPTRNLHRPPQDSDTPDGVADATVEIAASGRRVDAGDASARAAATVVSVPRHAEGTAPRQHGVSSPAVASQVADAQGNSLGMMATVVLKSPGAARATVEPAPMWSVAGGSEATPSRRFGQYELIREIGRGGMGTVHLARDLRLGRLVAIKLLTQLGSYDNARFLSEARVTARCNHENIVVIHDVGEHDGQPYMVFEHVAGQTLRAWLDERAQHIDDGGAPIEPSVAISLIIPVVRALSYAHDRGIIHRDLKPANIMLTDTGTVKVLDFGIATLVAGTDSVESKFRIPEINEPGTMIGTLPYMSPEQLNGRNVDPRSDIWAVGIMLYQMVTGKHPVINNETSLQSALLDLTSLDLPMPSVSEHRSDLGPLAAIIDRCLLKDRMHRERDAHVLLAELEAIVAGRRGTMLRRDRNPFAGLAAFQEADADWFYGRDREVGGVLARLRSCPLVALAGPSGTGKSSLVRAGVIPLLRRSGEGWDMFIIRPGHSPLVALRTILVDLVAAMTGNDAIAMAGADGEPELDLRTSPGQLGAMLRISAHRTRRRVLVFVDQFEELYTLCLDPAERAAFLTCLDGVADDAGSPLRVLVSIRSDFLDRLAEHRALAERVGHGLMLVPPLDRDGLRDALVRPVEATDCRYEDPEIVDDMLAAVAATPSSLPLLQFAAARLWTERDHDRRLLTRASYAAMGGIAGTLASHADTVLGAIAERDRRLVRAIFERLVTPERTRDVVGLDELRELPGNPDDTERLIYRLVDARLLVVESRDGQGRVVELVHESLIERWPTLVAWLHENRDDADTLARLRTTATQWQASNHDEDLLLRGAIARRALAWLDGYRGELGRRERAYLEAVRGLTTQAERSQRRTRLQVVATVVAVPMILLVMAAVALVRITWAEEAASHQRDELRITTKQLRASLAKEAQQTRKITDLLELAQQARQQTQDERDNARHQITAAERAAKLAKRELEAQAANAQRALQSERELLRECVDEASGMFARLPF